MCRSIPARRRAQPQAGGRRLATLCLGLAVALPFALGASCASALTNRNPVGEPLPTVSGETLDGESLELPLAEPTVLLVGYDQDAQFDADRWLIGLLQVQPDVRILEVPTLDGLFPRLIADTIDSGMRSGIPSEDWETVVTLYGDDARRIVELTGNERGRNMRVLLVDRQGVVRWFHDRGFSAGQLLDLVRAVEELEPGRPRPPAPPAD